MNSQGLLLFCLGIWTGQTDISGFESLFKPILNVWPSSVVPTRGNVTLKCISFSYDVCVIKKEGTNLDLKTPIGVTDWIPKLHLPMDWPRSFEFYLAELEQSDAGCYTCECYDTENPKGIFSDEVLLLVTGRLPKPSLQAHQWSNVTAKENVTLHCQKPDNGTGYKMFMLLKEGISSPVQVQSSESNGAAFLLHNMTPDDTGNYSCIYHEKEAPFWASHPSDHIEILVSDVVSSIATREASKWSRPPKRVAPPTPGNSQPPIADTNVDQTDMKRNDFLPKPSLSAWPSSVASENSSVTLQCASPTPNIQLVLRKGDVILDTRLPHHLTQRTAQFRLTNLQQADAGYYTCDYYLKDSPDRISSSSDSLLLLVTGDLYKPSLQVRRSGQVTAGEKVNLQCQKPYNLTDYKMFALLKEGTSSPVQFRNSESDTVDFTLQDVTVNDTGRYSCVYLQPDAPFRASRPSDHLAISVAISPSAISECYTKSNLIRLGISAMFVVFMAVFLAEAWYSQRASLSRPRPYSTPGLP